ncbi:hypothetical protein [Yinghuangia seranimata]|uniref:hypothetical protein n=1 Tax=Yinghuangia seranimata TaxID=408067 RepID=UPI00248BA3D2|nr:hypothetical protein [Yinghuangia seranimata]MDI2128546.1 hypothetical protein [Yinghuangia seranimata]
MTAANMPTAAGGAWARIPSAPQPPGPRIPGPPQPGGPGPGPGAPDGDGRLRTLAVITVIVILLAAAVTVVALQPWHKNDTASVSETPSAGPQGSGATSRSPRVSPSGGGSPSASGSASASASPSPSTSPTADAASQASALSGLLDRSGSSRQSVVDAVRNADSCTALGSAVSDLQRAADARNGLLRELDGLKFDALPDAQSAISQLRVAWQESATADAQYASWAQAQSDNGCGAGESQKAAADAASGRATTAKQAFVAAWNPIATRYSLPTRTDLAI